MSLENNATGLIGYYFYLYCLDGGCGGWFEEKIVDVGREEADIALTTTSSAAK
jgi:hypothetical protein